MLNFCDFIQVYVFTTYHHLNRRMTDFISTALSTVHVLIYFLTTEGIGEVLVRIYNTRVLAGLKLATFEFMGAEG